MAFMKKDQKYKWCFESIGGTTRVKISTGQDLAHLAELDPKMWTVLSCPVKGLGIDEKSLAYIDADAETFAAVLNGDKDFVVAVAQGSITINGDAAQALVFCNTLF